jgi:hypothetical protein
MPHTIKRLRKKIILTNDTQYILDAYQEAIQDLSEEQKNTLGLSLESKLRPGLFPTVLKFAELVSKNKHGATECYLGPIEYSLNEFAFQLKERYLLCINGLVEVAGKTSSDAEMDKIDSRYILLRELLLRLVIVALSDEENRKRSGKQLINALDRFVKAITTEKGEALGLGFEFRMELNAQLARWVCDFQSAVTTIELIHAPENALTGLVNYLDRVKNAIKAHILVQCYPIDSKDDISDDWIEKTYQKFLHGQNSGVVAQVHPLSLSLNVLSEAQVKKLEWIKSNKKKDNLSGLFVKKKDHISDLSVKKEDHISNLFLLLNHTELLYGMATNLDGVIQASHWTLLLTGKLSFAGLIEHLTVHRGLCNDLLDVKKTGLAIAKACKMLLAKDYTSGENITRILPELYEKLRNLGSHRHHRLIIKQFAENVTELLAYQQQLNIQVVCDVPMSQDRLVTNQHPVAQMLLFETPSQTSTQESIMAGEKYERQYDKNPFESSNTELPEEETVLLHGVERQPCEINNERSMNHNPDLILSDAALVYTSYLQDFFEQYENENQQESILSLQETFFSQQITMGGKNRDKTRMSYNMDEDTASNNFLYSFSQDERLFSHAGSFCRAVRHAILEFERNQMDAGKPTGFLLFLTKKDIFWECRHLESMCMKYLCVETAKKGADERDLEGVVKLCIHKGRWGFGSDYNELKFALQKIMRKVEERQIKLRKYLVQAPQARLEAENTRLAEQVVQQQSQINQLQRENQGLRTTIQQQNEKFANHDQEFANQRQEFANQRQEYTNMIQQLRDEISRISSRQEENRRQENSIFSSTLFSQGACARQANRENNTSHQSGFSFRLPSRPKGERGSSATNDQKKTSNEAQFQETTSHNTLS